jgi:hypothetical protein
LTLVRQVGDGMGTPVEAGPPGGRRDAWIAGTVIPRFRLRFEQEPRRRWWLLEWPARRPPAATGTN